MKLFIITIVSYTCLFLGCNSNVKEKDYNNKITGNWYLNKWTSYHTIVFKDSTIYVDNHVDTVFTLNYRISKDTLITWYDTIEFKNKIIDLDDSTLTLNGIHDRKEKLIYTKTFKGWLPKE